MTRTKPANNRVILWLLLASLASWIVIGAIGMALFT